MSRRTVEPMRRYSVAMRPSEYQALARMAAEQDSSVSRVVRQAIRVYATYLVRLRENSGSTQDREV